MNKSSLLWFFLPLCVLLVFGMTTVWSTAPNSFTGQIIFLLAGVIFFLLISFFDRKLIESISIPLYFLSLILLLSTYVLGSVTRGSVRWLDVGPFRFQPSEFAKPMLILSLASFFSHAHKTNLAFFFKSLVLVAIPTLLVLIQPDLGSAIIIFICGISLVLALDFPLKYPLSLIAIFLVLSPVSLRFLHPYQLTRIESFINPYSDPDHSGYNVIQSTIAVGSGQFFGKGVRQGTQSHLKFLPERHTDFAFASFSEEFGFIGVSLVLFSYFVFLSFILSAVTKVPDTFSRLVLTGSFWLFFSQMTINIGMNLGLMPVTGIPLPFITYGGSSLISSFLILGVVFTLTRAKNLDS